MLPPLKSVITDALGKVLQSVVSVRPFVSTPAFKVTDL